MECQEQSDGSYDEQYTTGSFATAGGDEQVLILVLLSATYPAD